MKKPLVLVSNAMTHDTNLRCRRRKSRS